MKSCLGTRLAEATFECNSHLIAFAYSFGVRNTHLCVCVSSAAPFLQLLQFLKVGLYKFAVHSDQRFVVLVA